MSNIVKIYFTQLLVLIIKEYIQEKNIAKQAIQKIKELILGR